MRFVILRAVAPGLRHGRVEEFRNHQKQPVGAVHERDTSRAGKHREPGGREPGDIPRHTAAEQPEDLHRVFGADDVGVADDNERGHPDRPDGLRRPAPELPVQLLHLLYQHGPVLRVRRRPGVIFCERGSGQVLGFQVLFPLVHLGVGPFSRVSRRGEDEFVHEVGVPDGDIEGDGGPML